MGEEKAKSTSQGGMFNDKSGKRLPLAMQYDYTHFYFGAGDDAFAMLDPYDEWWRDSKPAGYYLYGLPMQGAPTTRVDVRDTKTNQVHTDLLNFASYNYLGLSYRPEVKEAVIEAVGHYGNGARDPRSSVARWKYTTSSPSAWPSSRARRPSTLPDRLQRERRGHRRTHALGRPHCGRSVRTRQPG